MKNKIIFLFIFFISFFFINKVSALNLEDLEYEYEEGVSHLYSANEDYNLIASAEASSTKVYLSNDNHYLVLLNLYKSYKINLSNDLYTIENIFIHQSYYFVELYLFTGNGFNDFHLKSTDTYDKSNNVSSSFFRLSLYGNSNSYNISKIYYDINNVSVPFPLGGNVPFVNVLSTYDLYKGNTKVLESNLNYTPYHANPTFDIIKQDYVYSNTLETKIIGVDLRTYINNFNSDYTYYYRVNNGRWNEIIEFNDDSNGTYFDYILKENGTLYLEARDYYDDYITSATFTTYSIESMFSLKENGNYQFTDNNGLEKNYTTKIKIPIKYFYDNDSRKFLNNYDFYFLSKSEDDSFSDFMITREDNGKNTLLFPINVFISENAKDTKSIPNLIGKIGDLDRKAYLLNEKYDYTELKSYTRLPYFYTVFNDSPEYINMIQINVSSLGESLVIDRNERNLSIYGDFIDFSSGAHFLNINDFSTSYIVIYTNARIFDIDLTTNDSFSDFDNNYSLIYDSNNISDDSYFFRSLSNALNWFLKPIQEIFKMITYWFNNIPFQLRYTFIVIFVFVVLLSILRMIV